MAFAEYIHDKLRYFLHGKDPSICTCDEMIQHMYDVEPAMKETLVLYCAFVGEETLQELQDAHSRFASRENVEQAIADGRIFLFQGTDRPSHRKWALRILRDNSKELEYVVNILHGLSSKEYNLLRERPDAKFMDQHAFPLRYKKLVSVWRGRSRREADLQLSSDSLFRESLSCFARHNGMSREEVIELLTDTCNEISERAIRECWEEHLPIDSFEKSKIRKAMSEVRQKKRYM